MYIYQIVLILVSLLAIFIGARRYHDESFSLGTLILWILVWFVVILVALFPGISVTIASITGLGRGLDALYIVSIIFIFYIIFKLYNKIDDQKKRINELVSELAIRNHEKDREE